MELGEARHRDGGAWLGIKARESEIKNSLDKHPVLELEGAHTALLMYIGRNQSSERSGVLPKVTQLKQGSRKGRLGRAGIQNPVAVLSKALVPSTRPS